MTIHPLKAERHRQGWSQMKLAELLGVDPKTVSRWELGLAVPYPYYRQQLCTLFGKQAKELGIAGYGDEETSDQSVETPSGLDDFDLSLASTDSPDPPGSHPHDDAIVPAEPLSNAHQPDFQEDAQEEEQESNDLPAMGSVSLEQEPYKDGREKKQETIVSFLNERQRQRRRRTQYSRGTLLGLMLLCFFIGASSMYAAFSNVSPKGPKGPQVVMHQITTIDDRVVGTGRNQFNYVGRGWGYCTNNCPSNSPCVDSALYDGSNTWDSTTGDYVTLTFTGTQIKLYAVLASDRGFGTISIDGGSEKTIDFDAANITCDQLLWTSPTLPAATHTFELRVTGAKDSNSGDYYVAIDRAVILS